MAIIQATDAGGRRGGAALSLFLLGEVDDDGGDCIIPINPKAKRDGALSACLPEGRLS
jgi:hypothetical protein